MEKKPLSDRKAEHYRVSNLQLDKFNPRLPEEAESWSQNQVLVYMETFYDLVPIAQSMSDNGYFDEEPLIIIPNEEESGKYIVIEGNRRLAALKLLTDRDLRASSAEKKTYDALENDCIENLEQVPAILYNSRDETTAMMGFRHISGILGWTPFSKARFINDFIEKRALNDFSEVGKIIGETVNTVRRNYAAFKIFEQATKSGIDTSKVKDNFGVFYTAIGYRSFQEFIGITLAGKTVEELVEPVPTSHYENLARVIMWVHGNSESPPIISDSRELRYLNAVLESPDALSNLSSGGTLADSYALTVDEKQSVLDYINKASFNTEQALRFIHRHVKDAEVVASIERYAGSSRQLLNHFPAILKEEFKIEE